MGINDYEHVEIEGDEIATRFENDAYEGRLEFLHRPVEGWEGAFVGLAPRAPRLHQEQHSAAQVSKMDRVC